MSQFPPQTVYPLGIDNDYTLLLVHNTSEAMLAVNNEAWSDEVRVTPVTAEKPEIWADNGFANLEGELFYYDSVDKNADGKVYNLKRCARNMGGTGTKFAAAGKVVRGFVIAEHHNMLVEGIVGVENFVGYNLTEDQTTLDWRIRNLQATPPIFDDYGCPDVTLNFRIVSSDPSEGTLAKYDIVVRGNFTEFSLKFGDGTATSSLAAGEHRYAPNGKIDPVITIANNKCEVVQTGISRESSDQPTSDFVKQSFVIPQLPTITIPEIPAFTIANIETDVNLPPFLFPCFTFPNISIAPITMPNFSLPSLSFDFPSNVTFDQLSFPNISLSLPGMINLPDITINSNFPSDIGITLSGAIPSEISIVGSIPSEISIVGSIPSLIAVESNIPDFIFVNDTIPSTIDVTDTLPHTITVSDMIPSNINVTDSIPSNIYVTDDIPSTISLTHDIPSTISVTFPSPPCIPVCWGPVPTIPVLVTVSCPSTTSGTSMAAMGRNAANMREMMAASKGSNLFDSPEDIEVSYDISGFPSEIKILPPDDIYIKHDLPSEIHMRGFKFEPITFEIPSFPMIQHEPISFVGFPDTLMVDVADNFPRTIELSMPLEMPQIKLDVSDLPRTITVVGMPTSISVDPIQIELKTPEFIPLSYVGDAIPVSVTVQLEMNLNKMLLDNADSTPCVRIIPCSGN
jgi:hypothetical protein